MIYQMRSRKTFCLQTAGVSLLFVGYSLLCSLVYGQQGGQPRQMVHPEDAPSRQEPQRRVALVIGNGNYRNASRLNNPPNDARDMASTLRRLGFEVLEGEDQTAEQMKQLILQFGEQLRQKGGVGLFYYAGHGVQVGGRNYLIPIEAGTLREQTIEYEAVDVGRVLKEMEAAGNDFNIVVLDACRSNPFARRWRGNENGLAQINATAGTLIAYATSPDKVADDGTGRNGVYTAELLKQIKVPGPNIEAMFKAVRTKVAALTKMQQIPWESTSLFGDFYFAGTAEKNSGATTSDITSRADVDKGLKDDSSKGVRAADTSDNHLPQVFEAPYPHGALITTVGVPEGVSQILKYTKGVNHIALGLQGAWVVVESNGITNSSSSSTELQASLAALHAPLNLVAFAANGGWVMIQGTNGYITNNAPQDLVNVLQAENRKNKTILDVDFHPNGGWVVIAEDMTTSWAIPVDFNRMLTEIAKNGGVHKVAFSSKGWVIIPRTGGYSASGIPAKLLSELQETNRKRRRVYDIQLTNDGESWVLITADVK